MNGKYEDILSAKKERVEELSRKRSEQVKSR